VKTALDKTTLETAERIFAVSNTPSFLLRKLRDDQEVRNLAEKYTPAQLLSGLKRALKKQPKSLGDIVRPYAIVVGLSWYSDLEPLRAATQMKAPHHPWFEGISHDLLKRHSPIHYVDLKVPPRVPIAVSWKTE
jgi:hypothetical protein